MAQERIFPLILDAASKAVASGNIPVDTSLVKLNPGSANVDFTLPDGTIPGQLITLYNISADNNANIAVTSPFDADFSDVDLQDNDDVASFVWMGTTWMIISAGGTISIS